MYQYLVGPSKEVNEKKLRQDLLVLIFNERYKAMLVIVTLFHLSDEGHFPLCFCKNYPVSPAIANMAATVIQQFKTFWSYIWIATHQYKECCGKPERFHCTWYRETSGVWISHSISAAWRVRGCTFGIFQPLEYQEDVLSVLLLGMPRTRRTK